MWWFVVADVTHPLIGMDFVSHFGLLVDCRNNHPLDGVTSFSLMAQAASSLIPNVKTIIGGTPVDSLPPEFLDLIRPAGVKRELRHNSVHHIRDIPGSPVICRPRLARYRQSRFRRHVAGRHSSPLRKFLVFRSTHRAHGQRSASLRRLQSTKRPDNP
jgi:hypothetical protein